MARSRNTIIGSIVFLISLPVIFASIEAVSFYIRNRNKGYIVSSGETREYLLYVPKNYDPSKPVPLVISLHGGDSRPSVQMEISQWNRVAEEYGFIVVYPSGFGAGPAIWRVTRPGASVTKEVRFISDLIDKLKRDYNIDPTRIYANGLSNGGAMAFVLSCTLSDRIAAVGMVASAQMLPWSWCTDHRPVPMIAFHGTADSIVPYKGGTSWVASISFPDVAAWTSNWAERNQCVVRPVEAPVANNVTRREYADCANDATVVLYTIGGGGHTWPGGEPLPEWFAGPTNDEVDASRLMWEFFRQHPLSEVVRVPGSAGY